MRQIEKEMNRAFFNGRNFNKSNTKVETNVTVWDYSTNSWKRFRVAAFLHGNLIAAKDDAGNIYYSCAGWHTSTTRSRLQALGAPCRIKDYRMIDTNTGAEFPSQLTKFYSN